MYSQMKSELVLSLVVFLMLNCSLERTMQSTVRNVIYCFAWSDPKNVFISVSLQFSVNI